MTSLTNKKKPGPNSMVQYFILQRERCAHRLQSFHPDGCIEGLSEAAFSNLTQFYAHCSNV